MRDLRPEDIALLQRAFISLDAIGRTLLRLLVTHKRLLEWQTSGDSERTARADLAGSLHLELDALARSDEVGLRLCAEARSWLEAHVGGLADAPAAQRRLGAVGKRWGSAAAPLLEELVQAHPGERAFAWLLAGARR